MDENSEQKEIRLEDLVSFHPRAMKLIMKKKNFIVIAQDEPYFHFVYEMIRAHEIEIGRWNPDDESAYLSFSPLDQREKALQYLIDHFIDSWNWVQFQVKEINKAHGWYENAVEDGTRIALIHAELSEALEWLRQGNPPSDHIPDFTGVEEELADAIIRIMDFGIVNKYRLAEAIIAKIEFNRSRPYKHGGKRF